MKLQDDPKNLSSSKSHTHKLLGLVKATPTSITSSSFGVVTYLSLLIHSSPPTIDHTTQHQLPNIVISNSHQGRLQEI